MSKKIDEQEVKNLSEELFIDSKNGFFRVDDDEVKKADDFCEGYKNFLNEGKTERECVSFAIAEAEKAGFVPYDSKAQYKAGDKVYVNNRNKSVMLAVIGKDGCKNGVRIAASHIDSPRLDLKPVPLYEQNDLVMLKTHYYGGIKKYQWTAIPLAMHGRVMRRDGSAVDICIGEKDGEPQFCVTDLLPHLAVEQMKKTLAAGVSGEELNILFGSRPVRCEKGDNLFKLNIMKMLNEKYGIVERDLTSAEIEFVPAHKAVDVGFDRSMIGSYGHDDRVCAYPALQAVLHCQNPQNTIITVLTDKEEIGSDGNTGLNSSYLRYFVQDLAKQEGMEGREVLSRSKCLSADVSAAFDPTFASVYDAANSTYINDGVSVMKYTGSRGKGGTSDASAEFMGEITAMLSDNDVLWQSGEMGKVDAGGGGTVAMYVASMNVDVVDVGVPVLSMHAPFEVVAKLDVYMTYKACKTFFDKK